MAPDPAVPVPLERLLRDARAHMFGDAERAAALLDTAIEAAEHGGAPAELASAVVLRARVLARAGSLRALRDVARALPLCEAAGDVEGIATCHYVRGLCGALAFDVDEAAPALELAAATLPAGPSELRALIFNCAGFLVSDLGGLDAADGLLRVAVTVASQARAVHVRMSAESNLAQNDVRRAGLVSGERRHQLVEEAVLLLHDVLAWRRAHGDIHATAAAREILARALLLRGDGAGALQEAQESRRIAAPGGPHMTLVFAWFAEAECHLALGSPAYARAAVAEASRLAGELAYRGLEVELLQLQVRAFEAEGNYEAALAHRLDAEAREPQRRRGLERALRLARALVGDRAGDPASGVGP